MNNPKFNTHLDNYLESLLGLEKEAFLSAPAEPIALRVNALKSSDKQFQDFLAKRNYIVEKLKFNEIGYVLEDDKLSLSHSLAFFEGNFQYQGISSQIPAIVLDPKPGEKVLDMTAAPGSKATQMAAMMKQKGILVVNDSSQRRLQGLQTNMQRCGALNFYILKHRGEKLSRIYPEYFDKILIDAPCSALGTLSTNRQVRHWWSEKKLEKLSKLQYQLLVSAFKSLKVGGEMVYSTCSVAPEENEQVVEKMLWKFPLQITDIDVTISESFERGWTRYKDQKLPDDLVKAVRVWPHKHHQEGFFVINLIKTAEWNDGSEAVQVNWRETRSHKDSPVAIILEKLSEQWGIDEKIWQKYRYILTRERIWIVSAEIERVPDENFISAGILLGEKRISGWKLTNSSAQMLSDYILKRKLNLPNPVLSELFREGRVSYPGLENGYYVLEFENRTIASLFADKGNLRIRLPHAFNLVI